VGVHGYDKIGLRKIGFRKLGFDIFNSLISAVPRAQNPIRHWLLLSVPRPHNEGNNYPRQHLHLIDVGGSIGTISLHSEERLLSLLIPEVLDVVLVEGGEGNPDLSIGLGY
jgi:hypothetical protein